MTVIVVEGSGSLSTMVASLRTADGRVRTSGASRFVPAQLGATGDLIDVSLSISVLPSSSSALARPSMSDTGSHPTPPLEMRSIFA